MGILSFLTGRPAPQVSPPDHLKETVWLLRKFESCKLQAYQDTGGIWTIGWGHTGPEVINGYKITQLEADTLLIQQAQKFTGLVCSVINLQSTLWYQQSAMVSTAYNVGFSALENSTLLKLHNQGDVVGAAAQFIRWDHVGGQVSAGLLRRRKLEAEVYAAGTFGGRPLEDLV